MPLELRSNYLVVIVHLPILYESVDVRNYHHLQIPLNNNGDSGLAMQALALFNKCVVKYFQNIDLGMRQTVSSKMTPVDAARYWLTHMCRCRVTKIYDLIDGQRF